MERTVRGREHWLRLNTEPLDEAARWLDHYRTYWNARIDALETFLVHKKRSRTESRLQPAGKTRR